MKLKYQTKPKNQQFLKFINIQKLLQNGLHCHKTIFAYACLITICSTTKFLQILPFYVCFHPYLNSARPSSSVYEYCFSLDEEYLPLWAQNLLEFLEWLHNLVNHCIICYGCPRLLFHNDMCFSVILLLILFWFVSKFGL